MAYVIQLVTDPNNMIYTDEYSSVYPGIVELISSYYEIGGIGTGGTLSSTDQPNDTASFTETSGAHTAAYDSSVNPPYAVEFRIHPQETMAGNELAAIGLYTFTGAPIDLQALNLGGSDTSRVTSYYSDGRMQGYGIGTFNQGTTYGAGDVIGIVVTPQGAAQFFKNGVTVGDPIGLNNNVGYIFSSVAFVSKIVQETDPVRTNEPWALAVDVPFAFRFTPGNAAFIVFSQYIEGAGSETDPVVTDDQGNTYVQYGASPRVNNTQNFVYACLNVNDVEGAPVVTITQGGGNWNSITARGFEWSGGVLGEDTGAEATAISGAGELAITLTSPLQTEQANNLAISIASTPSGVFNNGFSLPAEWTLIDRENDSSTYSGYQAAYREYTAIDTPSVTHTSIEARERVGSLVVFKLGTPEEPEPEAEEPKQLQFRVATVHQYTQATPALVWTINHGLNYNVGHTGDTPFPIYPIVDAYVDGVKLIPEAITWINDSTVELTFATPQAGYAIVV